jgi:hypothetical protein
VNFLLVPVPSIGVQKVLQLLPVRVGQNTLTGVSAAASLTPPPSQPEVDVALFGQRLIDNNAPNVVNEAVVHERPHRRQLLARLADANCDDEGLCDAVVEF